jgi:hypothetical protein
MAVNLFTTDHPIVSQTSCFDRKAHPVLSFVCTAFAIVLGLFPALFSWATYELRDFPETTGDQLTFDEVLMGAGLIFVFSCFCATTIVSLHRLVARFKD